MVVVGKKMDCQKVAPFLLNLPTFKKKDTSILGPQGLWSLSWWALFKGPFVKMSSTIIKQATPKFLSKFLNSDQNEKEIPKIVHGIL